MVCDGVGSAAAAERGSRAACRAVLEAVGRWSKAKSPSDESLLRLIHALWSLRVAPENPVDCATTCLFAAMLPNDELLVAQLGDGLVAIAGPDGAVEVLGGRTGFSNQTIALGYARSLGDWTMARRKALAGTAVLLASDGVSDDLIPERIGDLILHLTTHFGPMAPAQRQQALRRELIDWQTAHHRDDKTLAVIWQSRES